MSMTKQRLVVTKQGRCAVWLSRAGPGSVRASWDFLDLLEKIKRNRVGMGTATSARLGFKAGVKDYRLTYYMKDYRVDVTDLLAAFRVIAQPGVPPEEAGAAIAAESSTGTWTTVWTHGYRPFSSPRVASPTTKCGSWTLRE
jgi:hypothetical protein